MEKDLIFFGESGLTSTSANFIANMAKEMYATAESNLDSMIFYDTTVKLIGTSEETPISKGADDTTWIPQTLKEIAQLKSLIAWLREAIKAKERLVKEAQDGDYEWYSLSIPERPEREDYITKDDVIASLNIKQRNRYYYLEAFCATIGQYIHPGGVLARERDQLKKVLNHPHEIQGSGRDTLMYTRTSSVDVHEVENCFMSLQQTYREYQAELNSIKYEIEDAVNKDTARKNIDYNEKMKLYQNQMAQIDAELTMKRKEAVQAASNLKIIIPDSLKAIYEKVQSMGKK